MKNSKKKLSLKKKTIFNLNNQDMKEVKGGRLQLSILGCDGYTGGCTDGCTGSDLFCSYWNCSLTACTNDCIDDVLN